MKKSVFIFILLSFHFSFSLAQKDESELLQFSGVVVTGDSLMPVPYTNIIIKNTFRGTMSDFYGFFSFVAAKGDTILFSNVGYKRTEFIIPDSLPADRYSLIQVLYRDTILLPEALILPWPTKEQFKQAFVALQLPNDDLKRAEKNLALAQAKEELYPMGMDGSMNFRNLMQNRQSQLYTAGQYPVNNLLNPIAWAKFIEAWREGKFKRKDTE
ncbi:MAG TPA: carboxypeptidase-like regulatory domain-containing protein [Bacteroidia bacterium]|nr:carboxypeptidase-like regulatory domain-containing protein [Bacteroidia bacterium]HNT80576.1 carboxypeptidase-like regulatory domain-containing protein [Bacteroidia bacterium]